MFIVILHVHVFVIIPGFTRCSLVVQVYCFTLSFRYLCRFTVLLVPYQSMFIVLLRTCAVYSGLLFYSEPALFIQVGIVLSWLAHSLVYWNVLPFFMLSMLLNFLSLIKNKSVYYKITFLK